ncbi:SusC/RagA family TonB-linked outer membrane protein [Pedobacter sp.]
MNDLIGHIEQYIKQARLSYFFVLFFLLIFSTLKAQQGGRTITATVQDADTKETLIGVFVYPLGNNKIGTITNHEGKFSIKATDTTTLVVSYVGYTALQIKVNAIKNGIIALKANANALSEVLIIGYGTVERKDLTGSVAEVKMEDLRKAPVASFDQALAGRVAGVQVSSGDGQPGDEMNIVIRGGNSITQTNAPLYVVDGFPMEDFTNAALNPADIKSITILKDASSTAIYGARGANGVILIETKSGDIGKPVVSYSGSFGFNEVTKTMDMLNPYQFAKYQIALNNVSNNMYNGQPLEYYQNLEGYDWQDMLFQKAGMNTHNVAISGGTNQTKYNFSGSTFKQDGVIMNSGFNRYQFRGAIDQAVGKNVRVGVKLNYSNQKSFGQIVSESYQNTYSTALLYSVWGYRPITGNFTGNIEDDLYDDDIDVMDDRRVNPIVSTRNEFRERIIENLNLNGYLNYDIGTNLKLRITGAANTREVNNNAFNNTLTRNGSPRNPNNVRGVNGSTNMSNRFDWSNENTITYAKTFNKRHKLNLLGGFSVQGANVSTYGYSAQNVPNEDLVMAGLGDGIVYSVSALESENTLASFYSRANYTFNQKYNFTATIRADGSSKFAEGNKWGFFPSGAFSWNLGQERFVRNVRVISEAKLRVSYGITGNNRVGDFEYMQPITLTSNSTYSFDNVPFLGAIPASLGNSNLRWESTAQLDVGLNLSLFRNRVSLTVDYYSKTTKDLLLDARIPNTTGYKTAISNVGRVKNEGMEFTVSTVNIKRRNFSWTSDFNISFNRNELLELANNQESLQTPVSWYSSYNSSYLYLAKLGGSAAQFYGYVFDGIYQYDDFVRTGTNAYLLKLGVVGNGVNNENNILRPGDPKFKDTNNDGVIDANDMVIIGRTLPLHTGGFSNNISYKGFSLNVLLQWSYGNDIYNANRIAFENNEMIRNNLNQYTSALNYWTPENQNNQNPRLRANRLLGVYSSYYLEDGSYLRLKTVSFAYDLPKKWIRKVGFSAFSVNFSGQNLYTWTNYSGMDPEVSSKNSVLTPGFDYSSYPRGKVYTLGIKAAL